MPDRLKKEAEFVGVCTSNATHLWDQIICINSGFNFQTFVKQCEYILSFIFFGGVHFYSPMMLFILPV